MPDHPNLEEERQAYECIILCLVRFAPHDALQAIEATLGDRIPPKVAAEIAEARRNLARAHGLED